MHTSYYNPHPYSLSIEVPRTPTTEHPWTGRHHRQSHDWSSRPSVDGLEVDAENVVDFLIGPDTPDSDVSITVKKRNGEEMVVGLKRMATERVADKRQMFEYFTQIKDAAVKSGDNRAADLVDATVDLWSKMVIAQEDYDATIHANVSQMQAETESHLKSVQAALEQLKENILHERRHFNEYEAKVNAEISELKNLIQKTEKERDDVDLSL
eukprot:575973-Hanusia_phi.AAC.1